MKIWNFGSRQVLVIVTLCGPLWIMVASAFNSRFLTWPKSWKTGFSAKQKYVAPYGDSGRFGLTEWSGKIFCVEVDPASPSFCLTEWWVSFKIMIFYILGKSLHHQMIFGPPDGSLDFFYTPGASGWTAFGGNPFWKMPPEKNKKSGKLKTSQIVIFW